MLCTHVREYGCSDEYLTDQLIIFMALARGTSCLLTGPLSLHTRTAMHFAETMTGDVSSKLIFDSVFFCLSC